MSPENNPNVPTKSGQFLFSCLHSSCDTNLVCDGLTYTCKKIEGQVCQDKYDCTGNLVCSGICTSGPFGELDQYCPCNAGYTCVERGVKRVCKGQAGTTCSQNENCASNFCQSGACTTGFPNAYPCVLNSECTSNNCSLGFCQPPGVVSGVVGASCAGNCIDYEGAGCNSSEVCFCSAPDQPGMCVQTISPPGAPCSSLVPCNGGLNCLSGFCSFDYPDANAGPCIPGLTLSSGQCLNNTNLVCNSNANCLSGNCTAGARITYYTPTLSINNGISVPESILVFHTSTDSVYNYLLVVSTTNKLLLTKHSISTGVFDNWATIPLPTITGVSSYTIIDAILINTNTIFMAVNTTSGDLIVTFVIGSTQSTPFNPPTPGALPIQYDVNNQPITIKYVDYSTQSAVLIGSINNIVYYKQSIATKYIQAVSSGPRAQFYTTQHGNFEQNITVISNGDYIFTGDLAGQFIIPNRNTDNYNVVQATCLTNTSVKIETANMMMLAKLQSGAYNIVIANGSNWTAYPYQNSGSMFLGAGAPGSYSYVAANMHCM